MCGGGGWDPGEAMDDTQMAVLVAQSLLERGGLDLPDIFARFQRWGGLRTEGHRFADRRHPDQRYALGPRRRDPLPGESTRSGKRLVDARHHLRNLLRDSRPGHHHGRGPPYRRPHPRRPRKVPRSSTHSSASPFRTPTPSPRCRTTWHSSIPTTAAAIPPSSPSAGTPMRQPSSTAPSGPAWAPPSGPCAPPPASRTPYARRSTAVASTVAAVTSGLAGAYYGEMPRRTGTWSSAESAAGTASSCGSGATRNAASR